MEYTYDSWGKLLSTTGSMAGTIGKVNPFLYRGYYYDSETGLYYLNSRYYDAQTGRFLNADDQINSGTNIIGTDLFAYCNNNPIMMEDQNGHFAAAAAVYFIPGVGEIALAATIVVLSVVLICMIFHVTQAVINDIQTISNADARIRSTVKHSSRTRYWTATMRRGYVDLGRPISYSQAVTEVKAGRNVITVTGVEAKAVATAAGGRK